MKFRILIILILFFKFSNAQFPMGGAGGGRGASMNMGRLYGKIIDSVSGKPMEFAVVQLYGNKFDTVSKTNKYGLITGELTKANGEFNLEGLPVFGELNLKISAVGYATIEKKVGFNINFDKMKKPSGGSDPATAGMGMLNAVDKDLGNFKMQADVKLLKEVVVDGGEPIMEMKMDKKIFHVDRMLTVVGGTAEDILKTVPAVSVDMDGNVTMRNASPQIFVDGRPTTLTVDQIPADVIQSVEVISNPSAKYDASGGMAGILNIVLKKNKRIGYNGSVRVGVDKRGMLSGGGDLNAREGKINVFASAFLNQRKTISSNLTTRDIITGSPLFSNSQSDTSVMLGFFGFTRAGLDYFINNRNTITLSGQYGWADFNTTSDLRNSAYSSDATFASTADYYRLSNSRRSFSNAGGSLLFKHLFPKEGRELTADVNYNTNWSKTGGNYNTQYYDSLKNPLGATLFQQQLGGGGNDFLTAQMDYTHPISAHMKIETGIRGAFKKFSTRNDNYIYNSGSSEFVKQTGQSTNYDFNDQVYAAYLTFSHEYKKISYNVGLRFESSFYSGRLKDSASSYSYQYPIVPFPSLSFTYKMTSKTDLQISYSRKINRPGFMQIIPIVDFSDSLNLKRGNPNLKPEFTNSLEINVLHNFNRTNNIMLTGYYKYSTGLITNYQLVERNDVLNRDVLMNTYENALYSNSYGGELTTKNTIKKWFDVTFNVNAYNSIIYSGNIQPGLKNERFSWFSRIIASFKITKDLSFQFTAEYQSRANNPANSGGGGGGRWGGMGGGGGMSGGMMMGGGGHGGGYGQASATSQGYIQEYYVLDAGIKWSFLKSKNASLNINFSDILKTKIITSYLESSAFKQTSERRKDQQFFRINFSYKFGKFDVSLFKRKNLKMNSEGMEMGM